MSSNPQRRLAAIVFTDLVDFSLLSGKDENKALKIIQKQKEIVIPLLKEFKGTLHKETGDGLVLTFQTVTNAVKFSINLQRATKALPDLNLRIGIHEGEITFQDNDILGDDVNITSRIEPFAADGGIAISGKVQQNLLSLPEFETKYIGKPKLKGISQTIEVYCITSQGLPETNISQVSAKLEKEKSNYNIFTLTGGVLTVIGVIFWIFISLSGVLWSEGENIPSIGILLMENKGNIEDDFWSERLTEELLLKISSTSKAKVISINNILQIDSTLSLNSIVEKSNIQYILSSSLYKDENEFDLFCQLIDAKSSESIYVSKWTETIENSPAIVGNMAENILLSLNINTNQQINNTQTKNAESYEYFLRAGYLLEKYFAGYPIKGTIEDAIIIQDLLEKAIDLDNDFIMAKLELSSFILEKYRLEYGEEELMKNIQLHFKVEDRIKTSLLQAEKINKDDEISYANFRLGELYSEFKNTFKNESPIYYYDKSLKNNRNNNKIINEMYVLYNMGGHYERNNDFDKALDYYIKSFELAHDINFDKIKEDNEHFIANLIFLDDVYGNYEKLIKYSLMVIKFYENFEQIDFDKSMWKGLYLHRIQLAKTYLHQGKFDNAVYQITKLEELAKLKYEHSLINNENKGNILATPKILIGNIFLNKEDYNSSIRYYNEALKIYDNLNPETDKKGIVNAAYLLGIAYFMNDDFDLSKEYFSKALLLYNQYDVDETLEASILSWIVMIDSRKLNEKIPTILALIENKIEKDFNFSHDGYRENIPIIYFNLYKAYSNQNDFENSYKYLKIAYDMIIKKSSIYLFSEAKFAFLNNFPFNKAIIEEYNKVFKK